jgi:hypothetical protein
MTLKDLAEQHIILFDGASAGECDFF